MNSTTYFTNKDGRACKITGDDEAVTSLNAILESAGLEWNEEMGTWDEGFYREPDAVLTETGWRVI